MHSVPRTVLQSVPAQTPAPEPEGPSEDRSEPKSNSCGTPLMRWGAAMEQMHEGTKQLFLGNLETAEAIFCTGMQQAGDAVDQAGQGEHDLRGAFALNFALAAVIRGVLSMENDQLDECRERLLEADRLAAEGDNWIGQAVVRGIVTLQLGAIQVLQHSFVKGVYNVLRAWLWIKRLETEALDFDGPEREIIRSVALITLGGFNLIISLLPASLKRAASWMSGFAGDRDAGLRMIRTCQDEGGLLAPWSVSHMHPHLIFMSVMPCMVGRAVGGRAAASWLHYTLDTKTFVGEERTADDLQECRRLLAWANDRFPASPFFALGAADLFAAEQNCAAASAVCEDVCTRIVKLPALNWLFNWKQGLYALTRMDWKAAGRNFATSTKIYVDIGRRSMVPCVYYPDLQRCPAAYSPAAAGVGHTMLKNAMLIICSDVAMQAATCFLAAAEELVQSASSNGVATEFEQHDAMHSEAVTMLHLIVKYMGLDKSNWGRQDIWAFRQLGKYATHLGADTEPISGSKAAANAHVRGLQDQMERMPRTKDCSSNRGPRHSPWALLDIAESMVISLRCVGWMTDEAAQTLSCRLQNLQRTQGADEKLRVALICAELAAGRGGEEGHAVVLAHCARGLALQPSVSKSAAQQGLAPFMHYIIARELARQGDYNGAREAANKAGKNNEKGLRLEKLVTFKLGVLTQMIDSAHAAAFRTIAINARSVATVLLEVSIGMQAKWEWTLGNLDIKFRVEWTDAGGSPSDAIVLHEQQRVVAGSTTTMGSFSAPNDGSVWLIWDNKFSMLRSKTVLLRTSPNFKLQD